MKLTELAISKSVSVPVIVLNWNGWADTFSCLRSLSDARDVGLVWLVDNASGEDRRAEAAGMYPGLRCLRFTENHGFAGGSNRALRQARAEGFEFAYLLNNDTVVQSGFLSAALALFSANRNLASVGSVILYAESGTVQFDGDYHSPGVKEWRDRTMLASSEAKGARELKPPDHLCGAGMLVRLDAMERFGYFDERFFCYREEAEWCWRMARHGLEYAVCLESVILHKNASSDTNGAGLYYKTRNRFLLLESIEEEGERRQAIRRLLYETVVLIESARREKDRRSLAVLVAALDDGLRGRFGKRPEGRIPIGAWARIAPRWAFAHVGDKWQTIRRRPPGR